MSVPTETIHDIILRYKEQNFIKINVYGVVTFIGSKSFRPSKCISITIVDTSCEEREKLKCIVFKNDSDKAISDICELGDIVRLNRIKIQEFNSQPQGVLNATFSSWIRFKRAKDNDFSFEGNNPSSSIDDEDKKRVKELREWLKTNPKVDALYEAGLSTPMNTSGLNENQLDYAASIMNMDTNNAIDLSKVHLKLSNFSQVCKEGFFDIICQICAVCDSKGNKFLLVWDATKSNFAVHQENEFTFESTLASTNTSAANSDYQIKVLFSKSILNMMFQVYIFDEFASQIDNLEPGDFILLKNARSNPATANSGADLLIKMPGVGSNQQKYGRAMIKLASYQSVEQKQALTSNPEINKVIELIYEKGKELSLKFINEKEFRTEYNSIFSTESEDTFAELLAKNKKAENAAFKKPSILSQVNALLDEDTEMYISDEENTNPTIVDNTKVLAQNKSILNIPNTMEIQNDLIIASKSSKFDICPEILKLKRLINLTYLVPFMSSQIDNSIRFIPRYLSLKFLSQEAEKNTYLKGEVIAKLFNYSISACPRIGSVFVMCKKCNYINFTPFHLASIYQSATLNNILNNTDSSSDLASQFTQTRNIDSNFSLEWLQSALPSDFMTITPTQSSQTQSEDSQDDSLVSYCYSCPRCDQIEQDLIDESNKTFLDYIYRFWFVLRDAESRLDTCLLEGDVAEKFLDLIKPIKFYTNQEKAHQVYKLIHKKLDKKYLFTIECFNFRNQNSILNLNSNRKLDILYKIVDIIPIG